MKFLKFLTVIGKDIEHGLEKAIQWAQRAMPIVDAVFPNEALVYNATVGTVALVEQKFAAIGKQSGSGADKLKAVMAVVGPLIGQYLGTKVESEIENYVNAVVAAMNIPVPSSQPAAPAPQVAATSGGISGTTATPWNPPAGS